MWNVCISVLPKMVQTTIRHFCNFVPLPHFKYFIFLVHCLDNVYTCMLGYSSALDLFQKSQISCCFTQICFHQDPKKLRRTLVRDKARPPTLSSCTREDHPPYRLVLGRFLNSFHRNSGTEEKRLPSDFKVVQVRCLLHGSFQLALADPTPWSHDIAKNTNTMITWYH